MKKFKKVRSLFILQLFQRFTILLIMTPTLLNASEFCKIDHWSKFSIYAISSIRAVKSDFQGLSGAGQNIIASQFYFGPNKKNTCGITVAVGNKFHGEHGSIDGILNLFQTDISEYTIGKTNGYSNFRIPSVEKSNSVDHEAIAKSIYESSHYLQNLKSSEEIEFKISNSTMLITLGSAKIQVLKIDSKELNKIRQLTISGQRHQSLILNIESSDKPPITSSHSREHNPIMASSSSAEITLSNIQINLIGMFSQSIIWNFHSTKFLTLYNIGGSNSLYQNHDNHYRNDDGSFGIQGFIFAPYAKVNFSHLKITGSLIADSIDSSQNHSGQINLPPEDDFQSPCIKPDINVCK